MDVFDSVSLAGAISRKQSLPHLLYGETRLLAAQRRTRRRGARHLRKTRELIFFVIQAIHAGADT
jgi:hypothetical protein